MKLEAARFEEEEQNFAESQEEDTLEVLPDGEVKFTSE